MPGKCLSAVAVAALLAGCASNVTKSDGAAAAPQVVKANGAAIVLNLTGSTVATSAKDWNTFRGVWHEQCAQEFGADGALFTMQEGDAQPTGADGTLVVVNVADFRYVSTGARIAFGIMTGNAFVNAEVTFRDLKTGDVRETKHYDTTSSAWEGVFSGMTTKQVHAMCHEIVGQVSALQGTS